MKKMFGIGVIFVIGAVFGGWVLFNAYPRLQNLLPDNGQNLPASFNIAASAPAAPTSFENMLSSASEKIAPAVVNIDTAGELSTMFGTREVEGKGSGVIISADGYVVTNNHVVRLPNQRVAENISVRLANGRSYRAKVIGTDPRNDIALLKVNATRLPAAQLADSDKLKVGDWVIAVGNPFGLENTVTAGIVSAMNRSLSGDASTSGFIQTDAAINRGNSGGALANSRGQLVGVNTAIISPSGGSVGIGFAIPINRVKSIVQEIIQTGGSLVPAWMGVSYGDVSQPALQAELKEAFPGQTIPTSGAIVGRVMRGSPAANAGIQPYDILTTMNGKPIRDIEEVGKLIRESKPGNKLNFKVWREGRIFDATVTLGEAPSNYWQ